MNPVISLSNKGKKWTDEQDDLLTQQYEKELMNIADIAKIHLRTVGGIISRLKSLDVLPPYLQPEEYYTSVRGYPQYLQDAEFMKAEKESRVKKEKLLPPIDDLTQIKRDILHIRQEVNEILNFLKSIYEFEQEQ